MWWVARPMPMPTCDMLKTSLFQQQNFGCKFKEIVKIYKVYIYICIYIYIYIYIVLSHSDVTSISLDFTPPLTFYVILSSLKKPMVF